MADVKLTQVRKSFGEIDIIRGVDLDIKHGEFVVFVGPSGCGELRIGDQVMNHVDPSKRGIAMVFQSYALYPHMTVRENMGFALKHAGVAKDVVKSKVDAAAKILGLEPLMDRKPKALSGGQRQRVAIGRAIVRDPQVFLFDEPLSNLDAELRVHMRIEIARLHRELGSTIIYVTHDQVEAMTLADKIVVLRAGVVEQVGAPLELYDNPANTFVAGFIGSPKMNFLAGELIEGYADYARIRLHSGETLDAQVDASALTPGEAVTVGLRPEHAELGTATQHIVRQVQWQERLGESTYLYLDSGVPNEPLVVKAPGQAHAAAGQRVAVCTPASALHVFNRQGYALERRTSLADRVIAAAA